MPTETEIQKFMKKNTFHCKKLNARISKKSCDLNQKKPNSREHTFYRTAGFEATYCKNCKRGKRYYIPEKANSRAYGKKECLIHQVAPERCKSKKVGGIFHESPKHPKSFFIKKKYCCKKCSDQSGLKYIKILIERHHKKIRIIMKTHHLKTWPDIYEDVRKGYKTFEYRLNDRDFKVGDILVLEEWDNITEKYTGRKMRFHVIYCLYGPGLNVPDGYVIMSIDRIT